ncbi:MAG: PepSY domain-containing protein [Planctomycetes bacterium]|nr:PepSY domain-containing protein [Planctomycetota bacterium]
MSHGIHALAAGALALVCSAAPFAFPRSTKEDPRDLAPHTKVSLREAVEKAVAAKPGRAFEAELELWIEGEQHGLAYEVELLGPHGELFEVSIDAATGAVRSAEQEEAEDDDDELREARRALRHCELDLAALIAKGEELAKGSAVAAALEFDDGPVCELLFANGRYLIEMELEGRAGHLLEIELLPEKEAGGEDEDDDGDGDDDDGDDDDGDGDEEDSDEDDGENEGREGREKGDGGEIHVRRTEAIGHLIGVLVGIF